MTYLSDLLRVELVQRVDVRVFAIADNGRIEDSSRLVDHVASLVC